MQIIAHFKIIIHQEIGISEQVSSIVFIYEMREGNRMYLCPSAELHPRMAPNEFIT